MNTNDLFSPALVTDCGARGVATQGQEGVNAVNVGNAPLTYAPLASEHGYVRMPDGNMYNTSNPLQDPMGITTSLSQEPGVPGIMTLGVYIGSLVVGG